MLSLLNLDLAENSLDPVIIERETLFTKKERVGKGHAPQSF